MRPRLLDLFCGAGGCTKGYQQAGFEVWGVDIEAHPDYVGERFHQADALLILKQMISHPYPIWRIEDFDAIHASPPCQAYSILRHASEKKGKDKADLVAPTRELLQAAGLPYVIENVPGPTQDPDAQLRDPIMLCGTMFGLPLYRHRLFECSFPVTEPLHGQHYLRQVKMGRRPGPGEIHQPVGHFSGVAEAREAMEMPWASQDGLREAIPPAYARYIGAALLEHISAHVGAAA